MDEHYHCKAKRDTINLQNGELLREYQKQQSISDCTL